MSDLISMKAFGRIAGVSLIVFGLGACAQMTKHSNTLVFATNTVDGLKVGTDANQVPTVQFALTRQEIAFVPVLANTGAEGEGGDLIPCPSATDVDASSLENCKFVATHGEENRDAYSTLASFGSKKGGEVGAGGGVSGTATIAQYFATGIAAQYLAITGGANVVSAGGDTKAKADATEKAAEAIQGAEKAKAEAEKAKYDAEAAKFIKETIAPAGITIAAKIDTNNNGIIEQAEIDLLDPHVNAAVQVNLDLLKGKSAAEFVAGLSKLIPLEVERVSKAM